MPEEDSEFEHDWILVPKATEFELVVPDWYNIDIIGRISTRRLVSWDEVHMQACIGGKGHDGAGHKVQIRYHRDANGKVIKPGTVPELTATNEAPETRELGMPLGTLAAQKKILACKYKEESRVSLGVAAVKLADGTDEGRRSELYEYTGKWIHTMKDQLGRRQEEIAIVKAGGGGTAVVCLLAQRQTVHCKQAAHRQVGLEEGLLQAAHRCARAAQGDRREDGQRAGGERREHSRRPAKHV